MKNHCQTLRNYDSLGRAVYKNKRQYPTHDLGVEACKVINIREHQIHKLVTYKCDVCHNYHIGRNGKEIKAKYKKRIKREMKLYHKFEPLPKINLKIIGKIDL